MKQYLELLKDIVDNGVSTGDRTGTGRHRVFGRQLRFKMSDGFPLVTTRKAPYKSSWREMLWMISGSANIKPLTENGVHFWDKWALTEEYIDNFVNENKYNLAPEIIQAIAQNKEILVGSIGPMYGNMWRYAPVSRKPITIFDDINDIAPDKMELYRKQFMEVLNNPNVPDYIKNDSKAFYATTNTQSVDQLQNLVTGLKRDPYSARHVMSTWIPEFVPYPYKNISPQDNVLLGRGCLAPCHVLVQCFVLPNTVENGKPLLSLMMTQRSVDTPVGAVSNISQYAFLLHLLAYVCDMEAHELIYSLGDTHIYLDQLEGVTTQLTREPYPLPKLVIKDDTPKDIFKITMDNVELVEYTHHDAIEYPVSV